MQSQMRTRPSMYKINTLFLSFILIGCGGGGGGNQSQSSLPKNPDENVSSPTTKHLTELWSENSGVFGTLSGKTSIFDYGGVISEKYKDNNGKENINISIGTSQGSFIINCSYGENPKYYFDTNSITDNGNVKYDIGFNFSKSEVWNEVPYSYRLLTPQVIDNSIYEKLYKYGFLNFYWNKFQASTIKAGVEILGFPSIADQTRDICGWEESKLPLDNGWNTYLPMHPPSHAREAITVSGRTTYFRTIAWKAQNSRGDDQLLIRVGDYEGEGPCNSAFLITDVFFARQNGELIQLKKGYVSGISCRSPTIVALQGDYDINQPFTLEIYPFFTDPSNPQNAASLNEPEGPFAILNF